MKWILAAIVAVGLAASAYGQGTNLQKAAKDFTDGPLTNVVLIVGPNYNESSHDWGAEALLGYNLPKTDLPFTPWIRPLVGVTSIGNRWYGVSGDVSLNARLHPLSAFGSSSNSFFKTAFVDVNGFGGIGTDVSGQQFGPFQVPGHRAANGQGTAAITGYGLSTAMKLNSSLSLGFWFERTDWTTQAGANDAGGISLKWLPKGS